MQNALFEKSVRQKRIRKGFFFVLENDKFEKKKQNNKVFVDKDPLLLQNFTYLV